MYELITIAFSHYCEKARWVLDRNRVAYRERPYMPLMHFAAAARVDLGSGVGRADRDSTRFSTPILRGDGVHLADSSDIVRYVEPALYEAPEATELDRHFSVELGPHSRRVVYWFVIDRPEILNELADRNVGTAQAILFRALFPVGKGFMKSKLRIDEPGYLRSRDKTYRVADEVAERLRDGRPFLCGDRFSAADLSFAAMFAPGILPGPGDFGAVLPELDRLPEGAQALVRELREHPAGLFAQRMFAEHRWPTASA